MINEVKSFEQMCLFNLKNDQLEMRVSESLSKTSLADIEHLVESVDPTTKEQVHLARELVSASLFDARKILFESRALIFLTRDEYKKEFEYSEVLNNSHSSALNGVQSFGILIVVENDFIAKNKLIV